MSTRRVAIVGTGLAGYAVVRAIQAKAPGTEITIFDIGHEPAAPPAGTAIQTQADERSYYAGIYRTLKTTLGKRFPPMKSHFGEPLPKHEMPGGTQFAKSDQLGGLSNFWGATAMPFMPRDLAAWPIDRTDLDPYYRMVADWVGISGRQDGLNDQLGEDFSNRPPIDVLPGLAKLNDAMSNSAHASDLGIASGVNRICLETRPDEPTSCTLCGECMAGCYRGSVFSTLPFIRRQIDQNAVKFVRGKVRRYLGPGKIEVQQEQQRVEYGGFDQIFLAAGCLGTTEIVMRSEDVSSPLRFVDNAIFQVPIVHTRTLPRADRRKYLSQCQLIWLVPPSDSQAQGCQVQVYPNFDYLSRNAVPEWAWPAVAPAARFTRDRVLFARLYTHSDCSHQYEVSIKEDALSFTRTQHPDRAVAESVIRQLRQCLKATGYHIPPIKPALASTSSHYAGPLGFGRGPFNLPASGQIAPNIYVCDSAAFPDSPATSLSLTIMAFAARVAEQAFA